MKTIFGYDTSEVRDFGVIVSDKMYDVVKQFLVVHQMKYPKDVEFISDPPYDRLVEEGKRIEVKNDRSNYIPCDR